MTPNTHKRSLMRIPELVTFLLRILRLDVYIYPFPFPKA